MANLTIEPSEVKRLVRPTKGHGLAVSFALMAMLAFAGLDVFNRFCLRCDPYASAYKSWAWWAVHDYRQLPAKPDVVIFGSSLILNALNDCDATFLQQRFDAVTHHRASYFEQLLSNKYHPVIAASFAMGGQMASDVYALFSTMCTGEQAPPTVVWGIAPRDFIDSLFGSASDTETAHYMGQIAGKENFFPLPRSSFWTQVQQSISKMSTLYARRMQFCDAQVYLCKLLLSKISTYDPNKTFVPEWLVKYATAALPEDNGRWQWIVRPYSASKAKDPDNSDEYKKRYQPFREATFQNQLAYLQKILAIAKAQHSKVVLVNMPLQPENTKLLSTGVYEQYLQKTRGLAAQYDAQYIDYNKPGLFGTSDFADPIHLDGMGGMKFFRMLSRDLVVQIAPH